MTNKKQLLSSTAFVLFVLFTIVIFLPSISVANEKSINKGIVNSMEECINECVGLAEYCWSNTDPKICYCRKTNDNAFPSGCTKGTVPAPTGGTSGGSTTKKSPKKAYWESCAKDGQLPDPFCKKDPSDMLGVGVNVASAFLGIIGALALFMTVYGGVVMITSGGNQEKVTRGKQTLLWAIVGLILAIGSYYILAFFINAIRGTGS